MNWGNYHLQYRLYVKEIPKSDRHFERYQKHKNQKIVTTEVSGMKTLKPIRFTYTFPVVKEIIRLLCETVEGGKEEVERELNIIIGGEKQ